MSELRCDFDGPLPDDLEWRIFTLVRHQQWPLDRISYRKTRHGWHVIVTVDAELSPIVVVAAQAILGSDWKRENFNLARAQVIEQCPAMWREARRWNALYTSHTHFHREVPDGTIQGNGQ